MSSRGRYVVLMAVLLLCTGVLFWILQGKTGIEQVCPSYSETCLKTHTDSLLRERDLSEAARFVKDAYVATPEFRSECHTFMLRMGASAAKIVPDPETLRIEPLTVVCNYGFFQQYPASLLIAGVSSDRVRTFCERVAKEIGAEVPDAGAECFRGIGRGLPLLRELIGKGVVTMSSSAVSACAALAPTRPKYLHCISGVFSELARKTARNEMGLSVNKENPMWLCELQKGDEAQACLGNWKWTLAAALSDSKQIMLGQEAPALHGGYELYAGKFGRDLGASAEQVVWALGYEQARHDVAQASEAPLALAITDCEALPRALVEKCIEGYSVGLAKHGFPFRQYELLFRFCELQRSSSDSAGPCLRSSVPYLQGLLSPDERQVMCAEALNRFGYTCDPID